MKTLCERLGRDKAQRLIAKQMNVLAKWCRKQGCHVGICVIDAGGKDVPDPSDNTSRMFGPHPGSGLNCAMYLIDRSLAYVPGDKLVEVINQLRQFIDAQEKEYWEKPEQLRVGEDPLEDDGR